MGTTQPIRNLEDLRRLKEYFLNIYPNMRNYMLIHMAVNTALRISDLLDLTWEDVYDFYRDKFRNHLIIVEKKTKKRKQIALSHNIVESLAVYMETFGPLNPKGYIFYGRYENSPLSRSQAFRIIKNASQKLHFEEPVSCHSLRKTFGYHAWQTGIAPALLMNIYNHSSFQVTKRYLGIEQDDIDKVFLEINL